MQCPSANSATTLFITPPHTCEEGKRVSHAVSVSRSLMCMTGDRRVSSRTTKQHRVVVTHRIMHQIAHSFAASATLCP